MTYDDPFPLTQCKTIDEKEFQRLRTSMYLMEPKIDGWRMQVDVQNGTPAVWTRTNHIATGKAPLAEKHLASLSDMRLDGEMVVLRTDGTPDYNFTARCLGSGTEVCRDKQFEAERHVTYFVFDLLRVGDDDLRTRPYEYRREILEDLPQSDHVKIIPVNTPSLEAHLANLEQYEEGSVLKDIRSGYAGRRHKSWLKWKYQPTVDAQIIGYKPGQGKYAGMVGAIHFRSEEGVEGYCSGMDDETRINVSQRQEALIGRWIEIAHFGKLVDGYRHPQFKRFRTDRHT